jgi:hypothetical protein
MSGDYDEVQQGEMLRDADAPEHIAAAWRSHASERRGIVLTPTADIAKLCADALNAHGIRAEALSGETLKDHQRAILRLKSGETRAVATAAC